MCKNKEKISFVIPCYGSENTIENVVEEINEEMVKHLQFDYEIIMVNDSSPDSVWDVITSICKKYPNTKGINFSRNFGQHAALMAGYKCCTGDIVFSLDDDGQAPVDEIFKLINKLEEGYDVVYGKYPKIKQNKFRILGSLINEKMTEIMLDKPKNIKVTSFFVARKFVIDEMLKYDNAYPYVIGLVLRTTNKITNIEVNQRERADGKSGYTFKKLLSLWLNGFTAFSIKPLRIASILGFIVAFAGFIYGIFTIINKILNPNVIIGYSSMMAVILFIGGMIMMLLGMVGEYIGRIYISINKSPQFVIKEKINL